MIGDWNSKNWITRGNRVLVQNTRFSRYQEGVFMRLPHLLALALLGVPYICNAQTPADDVAAQIRSQGYRCDPPVAAYRDLRRSKPDSAVWVLNCRNASFRVRLDPNMAARITKLKNKS
jgi:hypothetical protein